MVKQRRYSLTIAAVFATGLIILGMACASTEPTATPVAPQAPDQPAAPTAMPQPMATLVTGEPTPIPPPPPPTRVLPTATPLVPTGADYGGTLRYGIGGAALSTLDPHHSIDPDDYRAMYQVYNQIVELGPEGELLPDLAARWNVSTDGRTITFNLQPNVKFQDGTDFNAQAVKWNFDRMLDPEEISPRRGEFAGIIKEIQTPDSNTITFQLTKAFRPFVALLADRPGFIVSPAAVQRHGEDYGANPVGTGPFILDQWRHGIRQVLLKNENYWQEGLPYLDRIEFPIVHDSTTKVAMLRTGELDQMAGTAIRAEEVPILRANPNLKVFEYQGAGTVMLDFNVNLSPYTSLPLRQAISAAIDRETVARVQFQGNAVPAYTLIAAGWAHNSDLRPITDSLDTVREKLAEAGYSGEKLRFGCRTTTFYLQICEVIHSMVTDAGINMALELVEPGIYNIPDQGYMLNHGLGLVYWFHRADPHTLNFWFYHSDGFVALRTQYNNPQLDPLIEEASGIYDIGAARLAYDEIQRLATEDAPFVPIVYPDVFEVMHNKVNGFIRRPDNWARFKTVWIEQ